MARKLWNRDFILLLQGSTVSILGDLMYSVAIGYWVYEKTQSTSLMGIMSSISMFVTMFLAPFTGSIVDKCSRKWVLVGIDVMQGLVMLTVGILAYLDRLNVAGVLLAALLAALGSVFYIPAADTLKIDIIPADDMVRGQSLFSGAHSLIQLAGNAFSGVLVALLGVPLVVILNGLSNLYSACSELLIRVPRTVQQGAPVSLRSTLHDSGQALKTILSDPCLQLFVPIALVVNLLASGPMSLVLPLCMNKGFTVDMYGFLMAGWSGSALLCVLLLGTVKLSPKIRYRALAGGFLCSVPFFIGAYLSDSFVPMCILAALASFANCAGNSVFNASMMLALPEENRGAILGVIQSACVGGSALSALLYGTLGDIFPLYLVFSAGALLSLVPMLILCLSPRTKAFILNH